MAIAHMASAFLFFVASLVVAEAGPLKIFVLAGQSNMEGQGFTVESITCVHLFILPRHYELQSKQTKTNAPRS